MKRAEEVKTKYDGDGHIYDSDKDNYSWSRD
jgi:hypothetical protein